MQLIGKILWWDKRDKNGIIQDPFGNEFYFDISVLDGRKTDRVQRGLFVRFMINDEISGTSCAKKVVLPLVRESAALKAQFAKIRQNEMAA